MSEKQLYTLMNIAQKLGVNYKTLYNYKDFFKEFLVVQDQGRQTRYLSINIEIFRKILEMKDDGATNADVHEVLSDWRQSEPEIFESGNPSVLPSDAPSFLPSVSRSFDPSFFPSLDLSGFPSFFLDVVPSVFPSISPSFLPSCAQESKVKVHDAAGDKALEIEKCAQCEEEGEAKHFALNHPIVAAETQPQPNQTGPDLETIQDMLDHSLSRLESRLLTEFSDLILQLNSALTQFYKFSHELLARLEKIETELGVEAEPMTTELDLEAMQVKMEPAYSHADLEFVKNSVHEGKPDKNAVKQWVLSERRKGPEQSYAVLAEVLNEAGVPTLSGREGWNRGTLRNIVAER